MATIVFVDQENGDIRSMLPKDHGTFLSSKPQSRKGVVSFPGKVFGDSEIVSKPSRKALGNVNKQILQNKAVMAQKINFKQNTGSIGKKVTSSNLQPVKDLYPEIEHYFPYNPLDFESFDIPEDHKLSHFCLAGVSLLVQDNEVVRFDALTNIQLCPLEMPLFNTDSDCLPSLISPLYEVTVDLPPFEDY
ncbi:hypothetical protein XENTR_v10011379 [Xenopus tropicalis]|uniref:Securin n=1 Tax=Xenopus tropicalis TaxID=8364 RepID=A0A803JD31_XENTR|nr:securin isoform X3 [Xenopus tropicalis]KAE8608029.1 hypothetical protein XENTR_v10011379 [Xenopus tropicalis]KAE8608030.1 hypothetical protein XENTR_v10011379 [Xenopus tropicalis]|eukprot:XP_004913547.1 PREDICTED: securin-like isoform X2 [Xenopus tropicalis]